MSLSGAFTANRFNCHHDAQNETSVVCITICGGNYYSKTNIIITKKNTCVYLGNMVKQSELFFQMFLVKRHISLVSVT